MNSKLVHFVFQNAPGGSKDLGRAGLYVVGAFQCAHDKMPLKPGRRLIDGQSFQLAHFVDCQRALSRCYALQVPHVYGVRV